MTARRCGSRQRLLFHVWDNGIEDELTVEIDSLPCTVNALGGVLCLTKASDAWSREKVSLSYAWKEEPQAE